MPPCALSLPYVHDHTLHRCRVFDAYPPPPILIKMAGALPCFAKHPPLTPQPQHTLVKHACPSSPCNCPRHWYVSNVLTGKHLIHLIPLTNRSQRVHRRTRRKISSRTRLQSRRCRTCTIKRRLHQKPLRGRVPWQILLYHRRGH